MFLSYKVTTDAATEPLTKTEVRLQLKNEGITADDDLLDIYIKAARQLIEKKTNTAMISQTITQTYNEFPVAVNGNPHAALELAVSPLISVTSVGYKDGDGDSQSVTDTDYDIDSTREPGLVAPTNTYSWPSVYAGLGAVTVVYLAGYADASSVPTALKQAMLLTIAHWYRNRIDTPRTLPSQADYLLQDYRVSQF